MRDEIWEGGGDRHNFSIRHSNFMYMNNITKVITELHVWLRKNLNMQDGFHMKHLGIAFNLKISYKTNIYKIDKSLAPFFTFIQVHQL
jgi:hypothetical protein